MARTRWIMGGGPRTGACVSDAAIRQAAFGWLTERVERHDDVLPRPVLQAGLQFSGARVSLVGHRGIFEPRLCESPLSVPAVCNGPHDDRTSHAGRFLIEDRPDPNLSEVRCERFRTAAKRLPGCKHAKVIHRREPACAQCAR